MDKICKKCGKITTEKVELCPICGSNVEVIGLTPGRMVGGFEIVCELGRGSNGIVYRARQVKLDREVALKILPVGDNPDKTYVEDFFKEARAAAKMNHPSIVMAYDAGVSDDGIYFFAMELINGKSLDYLVMRNGPPEFKDALRMALDMAEGLDYAWRTQKLTHGDIKPANIIIDPLGKAKIADLGLAKTANESYSGEIMATPMFAAPEVCSFDYDKIGFKSDMYSYACTLYYMFTGEAPFDENDTEKVLLCHINEQHVPLVERLPLFPQEISDFIDRMLAKNPDDRPADWSEVVEFFQKHRSQGAPASGSTQKLHGVKKKSLSGLWIGGILAILAIAVAVVAVVVLMDNGEDEVNPPAKIKKAQAPLPVKDEKVQAPPPTGTDKNVKKKSRPLN